MPKTNNSDKKKVSKTVDESKKRAKPKRHPYRTTMKRALAAMRVDWEAKNNTNVKKGDEGYRTARCSPAVAEAWRAVLQENANAIAAKTAEYTRMHLRRKTLSRMALRTVLEVMLPNKKLTQYISAVTDDAMEARANYKLEHAEENKAKAAQRKAVAASKKK